MEERKLVTSEKLQTLSELAERLHKLGHKTPFFEGLVFRKCQPDFWKFVNEVGVSITFLQGLIEKAQAAKRNDLLKGLFQVEYEVNCSLTMYYRLISFDARILQLQNNMATLEKEKFAMSDKIKQQEIEIENLKNNLPELK